MGYIAYRNFFFLENCRTIEDFYSNINSKIDNSIKICAFISSSSGLIPIPFADVPGIVIMEIILIKYIAKLYEINENEYSTLKLSTLGPTGSWSALGWNVISKVAFIFNLLDIIPLAGQAVSVVVNPVAIISFGNSIKTHFLTISKDSGRPFLLIKNVLKDFKSIYFQINELCNREKDSFKEDVW